MDSMLYTLNEGESGTQRASTTTQEPPRGMDDIHYRLGHGMISLSITGWHNGPLSKGLTCFPHGGGSTTVDYNMGSMETTQIIQDFTIPPMPPWGRPHLSTILPHHHHPPPPPFPPPPTIHFTHDCDLIYSNTIYLGLLSMDPSAPIDTLTSQLTDLLHTSTISTLSTPRPSL